MANKTIDDETFRSEEKKQRHRRVLKYILLVVCLLILGGMSVATYEVHRLNPKNHFKNLKVIGSGSETGKKSSIPEKKSKSPLSNYKTKSGTFNVLLIGSDARPGDKASHSDSMLLIHADLNDHTYNILSIPRDTRVYMTGYGYTKLTSVQFISQVHNGTKQGIVDAVKAISNLTGVPINYYAETNNWGLQDMVDAIGGIKMTIPFKVTLTHPWNMADQGMTFQPGVQKLDGKMVSEIVHERDSVPGTDYGRQQLQEEALIGIAKKMMQPSNVTKLPALAKSFSKFLVATNMTTEDMVSIGLSVKSDFHPKQQIHYRQVKGKNEVLYDDILKAKNDQIVLNPNQLQTVIQQYFTN